jgi:transglutaminase superfamily protein
MPIGYTDSNYTAPRRLRELRVAANDAHRARDWAALRALRDELRQDADYWFDMWAPLSAIAARHLGEPDARALLDEAVAAGYCQPDVFGAGMLAEAFGGDEDWPELSARIAANETPATLELLDWPTVTPARPLSLQRTTPDREAELARRVPEPAGGAWPTAVRLATWVSGHWEHGDAHVETGEDAVRCLDRVAAGERFACVEYTLVLGQALNALGIPARRVDLRQDGYHVGMARGHVVTEAWLDDLGRWAVLDGQCGAYWADADGRPLSVRELCTVYREGRRAEWVGPDADPAGLAYWWSLYGNASIGGVTWSAGTHVPVFQRSRLLADVVLRDPAPLYPDLSEVEVAVAPPVDGAAAVRLSTAHPYATGFVAGGAEIPLDNPLWTLESAPGEYRVDLAVRTRYGALAARPLRYVVR